MGTWSSSSTLPIKLSGATIEFYSLQWVSRTARRVLYLWSCGSLLYHPIEMTISPVVTQYYLQLKTNVPVPKLYGILGDIAVMKRVPGEPLAKAWASMPLSSKGEVVKQLANIQARLLRIRLRTIGRFQWDPSLFASQPQTPRFKVGTGICSDLGPQKSIGGLFKTLIGSLSEKLNENNRTKALLSRVRSRVASIVNDKNCNHKRKGLALEHDDLDPRNIMVDKDHVTGILDWDGATVIPRELASPGLPWLQGTYGMSEAEEREIATLFNIYETTLERAGEGEKALKLREATRYDAPPGLSDLWVLLSIEKTFGWAEVSGVCFADQLERWLGNESMTLQCPKASRLRGEGNGIFRRLSATEYQNQNENR